MEEPLQTEAHPGPMPPRRYRWLLLSTLPIGGTALAVVSASRSVSGKPLLDMMFIVAGMNLCFYVWVRTSRTLRRGWQWTILLSVFCLQAGAMSLLRFDGLWGDGRPHFAWRWRPTEKEYFMRVTIDGIDGENEAILVKRWAPKDDEFQEPSWQDRPLEPRDSDVPVDLSTTSAGDFPGFRGADRSGEIRDARLAPDDWRSSYPRRLWRQPIGTGWSAFAVVGDFAVTQEQRGEYECVVCYEKRTGRECWVHGDRAAFFEFSGGGGPRATPTIHDGRVYALGATGILNCLAGATGEPIWSLNILERNATENRLFGMAGSPLVTDDLVIVAPGGKGCSLVAYDRNDGTLVWKAGDAVTSYSSPQSARIGGTASVLIFNGEGLYAHRLRTGEILWNVPWVSNPPEKNNVCQPQVLPATEPDEADRVFISSGYGRGCALFEIESTAERADVRRLWATKSLKAKFTNVVARDGFVYGLDNGILACVDLTTGRRRWKRGRYGHGQLLLVGDLLLIQAENGAVVLVEASPDSHREKARFAALDHRTWNQPVLSSNLLLVRNDREAAAYELPLDAD